MEELQKKASELCRKLAAAKTPEEVEALNIEAIELKQQLGKISEAVHAGNPAPIFDWYRTRNEEARHTEPLTLHDLA